MRITEGAIIRIGVTRSQEKGVVERLRGSRSTMTGGAVAVAISVSPELRLQEFVRELLQVARRLVDVFVDDELTHLVIDRRGEGTGGGRAMRRAGDERGRLELGDELLGDGVEDTRRDVGARRDGSLL